MSNFHYYTAALKAIKSEMENYPSLGLVSKQNQGSHHDMDITDFYKSYEVFPLYLTAIETNWDQIKTFNDLKKLGYQYEKLMFTKTNDINTHKGLIFSLGIFYYSLLKNTDKTEIISEIKAFCAPLAQDLLTEPNSVGLQLAQQGISGARQVAMNGYRVVFDAYHFYKTYLLNQHLAENEVNFTLLIYFLTKIQDTTLINKIGLKQYQTIQAAATELLTKLQVNYQEAKPIVEEFNQAAIAKNISPGGAADLLVLTDLLIFADY